MKTQNRRDLEKHWAEQSRKRTPAEQLQFKAEKLRKKMERAKADAEQNGGQPAAAEPEAPLEKKRTEKHRKKSG